MSRLSNNNNVLKDLFPPTLNMPEDHDCFSDQLSGLCYVDFAGSETGEKIDYIFFVNMHIFSLNGFIRDPLFLKQVDRIKQRLGLRDAIVFNLDAVELMELQKSQTYSYGFLYCFECDIEKFQINSNYKRKARKAASVFTIKQPSEEKDIYDGLDLYYKMDFASEENSTLNLNYSCSFKIEPAGSLA